MKRVLVGIARALSLIVVLSLTCWAALVLSYAALLPAGLTTSATVAMAALGVAMMWALWRPSLLLPVGSAFAVVLSAVVVGWSNISPSNDRAWRPEVARLPTANLDGNRVTVRNIRHFDYREKADFTARYYDKTFDLDELVAVDLFAVYWMGPHVAHTMVSFAFRDGSHLAISIETRKEIGEDYSTLKGFFRQYELYYVVADERDVVRLRTTFREPTEDVYLYRVRAPLENSRKLFLTYLRRINDLAERPAFYNTLADNCTTGVWLNTLSNAGHLPLSWKLLLSGHVPQYLYEQGRLDDSLAFTDLRMRSLINGRASEAGDSEAFSAIIRRGLPGIEAGVTP